MCVRLCSTAQFGYHCGRRKHPGSRAHEHLGTKAPQPLAQLENGIVAAPSHSYCISYLLLQKRREDEYCR